jgi:hypothetical protein
MPDDLSPANPLSDQLAGYRDRLSALREQATNLARDLAPADWHRSPSASEWSIGQCFDHINIVNGLLAPRIEAAIAEARAKGWTGTPPFRYPITDRIFIWALTPETAMKLRAPGIYRPTDKAHANDMPDGATLLATFEELQARLMRAVEDGEGIDLRRAKVLSPFSPLIRVSVGAWIASIIEHERNHLQQAQRVRSAMVR